MLLTTILVALAVVQSDAHRLNKRQDCSTFLCPEFEECKPGYVQFIPDSDCCPAECIPDEKPGVCPLPSRDTAGLCVEMCSSDDSCPGDEKCCSNGCGHACAPIVQDCSLVECPYPDCADGDQVHVPDNQCCPVCLTMTHSGTCPALRSDTLGLCAELCSSDADCERTEKCCSNGCGHTCVEAVPEPDCTLIDCPDVECKLAYAPHIPDGECCPVCRSICAVGEPSGGCGTILGLLCNEGSVCVPGGYYPDAGGICCQGGIRDCSTFPCPEFEDCEQGYVPFIPDGYCCPTECIPVPHSGTCPALRPDAVGVCAETCSSDADCKPRDKCCSNGCGHTCVDAVPEIDCSAVSCLLPVCNAGYEVFTPEGECCPQCRMDCKLVRCPSELECEDGYVSVVPKNQCCARCERDCSMVRCLVGECQEGYIDMREEGECCSNCVSVDIDCSTILCMRPLCEDGQELYTPEGQCCPQCRTTIDCSLVRCANPLCDEGYTLYTPKGSCCGYCKLDCSAVSCVKPECGAGQVPYTPEGECCPKCKPDCSVVRCAMPVCEKGYIAVTPEDECCPQCQLDCSATSCLRPVCQDGVEIYTPEGECCPRCREVVQEEEPLELDCSKVDCEPLTCKRTKTPKGECCPMCLRQFKRQKRLRQKQCTYEGQIYKHKSTFPSIDGCNTCTCRKAKISCTEKYCPRNCVYKSVTYKSGESFQDDCNTCTCEDGEVGCTEMACPRSKDDLECPFTTGNNNVGTCQEECEFDADCFDESLICCPNACGGGQCIAPKKSCAYNNDVYQSGQSFVSIDGCNKCTCEDGQVSCTEMACPQNLCDTGSQVFLPGETYFNGCNTCSCTDSGFFICTLRYCPPEEDDIILT